MIFLSPGVKTREIDYSTYVGEISSCIVGMVGAATKGPVNVPTLVTSPSDFVDTFGEPEPLDYGSYCALEFLKQGNQLIYVRVGEDSNLIKAGATIGGGLITVTAKEVGTYGNQFAVELLTAEPDDEDGTPLYNLIIYRNDTQEEQFIVSFDPDRDDWIENADSYWVDVEYNSDKEIEPFISSFAGFAMNDNNEWEKDFAAGAETLDSISFETNVSVANSNLIVVNDSRPTDKGGLTPGSVVGTTSVSGTTFTVNGMGIEFPNDNYIYVDGEKEPQGVPVIVEGSYTYTNPDDITMDSCEFTPDVDPGSAEAAGVVIGKGIHNGEPELEANNGHISELKLSNDSLTITVDDLSQLTSYPSSNPAQGTHKWLGLDIDTHTNDITQVAYNGELLSQSDADEATSIGLPAGHFVLYVRADELVDTPKEITLKSDTYVDAPENTVAIYIRVIDAAAPVVTGNPLMAAFTSTLPDNFNLDNMPDLNSIDAVTEYVKSSFIITLCGLGLAKDAEGTPLTAEDVENLVEVTYGEHTEPEKTGAVDGEREIIEGELGDDSYVASYDEEVLYSEETPFTVSFNKAGLYYDEPDTHAGYVLGVVDIRYSFDIPDTHKTTQKIHVTCIKQDTPGDAFEICFKVDLVAETGISNTERILVKCVDEVVEIVSNTSDGESVTLVGAPKPFDIPTTDVPVALTGGDNGLPFDKNRTVVYNGITLFANTEDIDINLLAAPGRYEANIVTHLIEVAQNRADTLAIIDPPQGLTDYRDAIAYHNGRLAPEESGDNPYPKVKLNSSYGAFFYPWVQVFDQYSGENIWLPPSGVVLAAFAYNDRVGQPWFAAAGLNRGMLSSVLELEVTLDEGKRDALYGNGNAVNALVNYKQQGFTIWGNKTLQRKTSALDRINVRRLMNMIRKAIAATSAYLIFEQNDPLTWNQWKNQVDPYLESIKRSRGLDDYRTKMDEETVTPYYRDRNQMPGKVWINPTRTAEFIPIDFILTNSGAQFTE